MPNASFVSSNHNRNTDPIASETTAQLIRAGVPEAALQEASLHSGRLADLIVPRGMAAITFGSRIFVAAKSYTPGTAEFEELLAHELLHVEQYRHYGFARFILKYIWEYLTRGYAHVSFETEAREFAQSVRETLRQGRA